MQQTAFASPGAGKAGKGMAACYMSVMRAVNRAKRFFTIQDDPCQPGEPCEDDGAWIHAPGMGIVTFDPSPADCFPIVPNVSCSEVTITCGYGAGGPTQETVCICQPTQVGGPGYGQAAPFDFSHQVADHPNGNPLVFESQASGAQMWWHFATDAALEYIEVRHFDGTISRYESTELEMNRADSTVPGRWWRLASVLDPYDNLTTYTYAGVRLQKVSYPNGLEAHWDWTPSWLSNWPAGHTAIEITYKQSGALLPGLNWAMLFENVTENGRLRRYFDGRMVAHFAQAASVIDGPATGQLYDTATAQDVVEVTELTYGAGANTQNVVQVNKYWEPVLTASMPSSANRTLTLTTTYYQSGLHVNKVQSQTYNMLGQTTTYAYDAVSPTYQGTLPAGLALSTIGITGPYGGSEVREFDGTSGRVYRTIIDPGPGGRPRNDEGDFGIAGYPFSPEPERIAIDQHFDATCVCQKPIKTEVGPVAANGAFVGAKRVTEYAYDPLTKMVTSVTVPNPSNLAGEPATLTRTLEYHAEPGSWSPRWIKKIIGVDGTITEYAYPFWMPRAGQNHGRMQGLVSRTVKNVKVLGANATTIIQSDVSESVFYNVPGLDATYSGAPAYSGPTSGFPRGQARWVVDGDNITTSFLYDGAHGGIASATRNGASSAIHSTFTYDVWGRLSATSANVGSAYQSNWTVVQDAYLRTHQELSGSIGSVESKYYYDRWGNPAVSMRKSKASNGQAPKAHGASSSSAREWVRIEHLWQCTQLLESRVDRRPLDEGDGSPLGGANPLMAVTGYEHGDKFVKVTAPNGAVTEHQFDGFGTLFKTVIHRSSQANAPTLEVSRTYVNNWMEPVATVAGRPSAGANVTRWLVLERNAAGAVTAAIEPTAPASSAPAGYLGSLGGSRHELDIDRLGRTVGRRVVSAGGGPDLFSAAYHFDQLGRTRLTETHLLNASGGVDDTRWSASAYAPGKVSQVGWTQQVNGPKISYFYDDLGRVTKVGDAGASGNRTEYFYKANATLVDRTVRTLLNPAGPATSYETAYDYDALGRTNQVTEGFGTALARVHAYAHNSLGFVDVYAAPLVQPETFLHDALGRTVEHVKLGGGQDFIRNAAAYFDSGLADSRTRVERCDGLSVSDQDHKTVTHYDYAGRQFAVQAPGATYGDEPTSSFPNKPYSTYARHDDLSNITNRYDGDNGNIAFHYDGVGRLIQRELLTVQEDIATFNSKDVLVRDALGRVAETKLFGASNGGATIGSALTNTSVVGVQQADFDSLGRLLEERSQYLLPTNVLAVKSVYAGPDAFRTGLSHIDNLTGNVSQPLDLAFTPDSVRRMQSIDWDRTPGAASNVQPLVDYGWRGGMRVSRGVTYSSGIAAATDYVYDVIGRLKAIEDVTGSPALVTNRFDYSYDLADSLKKEEYAKVSGAAGDRFTFDAYGRLKESYLGVSSALMGAASDPTGYSAVDTDRKVSFDLDAAHNRESVLTEAGAASVSSVYDLEDATTSFEPSNRYATAHGALVEHDKRGNLIYDGVHYYRYDFLNRLQEVWRVVTDAEQAAQAAGATPEEPNEKAKYSPIQQVGALEDSRKGVYDDVLNLIQRVPREHKDETFRSRLRRTIAGGVLKVVESESASGLGGGGMPSIIQPATLELKALYGYDAFNRRVLRVVLGEETYVSSYDGWRDVQESKFNLSTFQVEPSKQFVRGANLDEVLSYRKRVGAAGAYTWENYFVQHGGQDTSVKLLDESGALVEQYEYGAYGAVSVFSAGGASQGWSQGVGLAFLWKGARFDSETGHYFMRNRYYSCVTGRFVSRDPSGAWMDPIAGGNAYAYAGSMPLTWSDPFGLQGDPGHLRRERMDHQARLGMAMALRGGWELQVFVQGINDAAVERRAATAERERLRHQEMLDRHARRLAKSQRKIEERHAKWLADRAASRERRKRQQEQGLRDFGKCALFAGGSFAVVLGAVVVAPAAGAAVVSGYEGVMLASGPVIAGTLATAGPAAAGLWLRFQGTVRQLTTHCVRTARGFSNALGRDLATRRYDQFGQAFVDGFTGSPPEAPWGGIVEPALWWVGSAFILAGDSVARKLE